MINNVLDMLENNMSNHPAKIAVKDGISELTHSELIYRSKTIGSALISRDLADIGKPVGIYMEKGVDALSCFFGSVYAGSCYSMLNTELPDNRLKQIQDVLKAKVIITSKDLEDRARSIFDTVIVTIDELLNASIDECALSNIRDIMIDTNPLYINFTSGSTGVPKGIAVAHRSVIEFIDYFTNIFDITENDVVANQAPFDFDVSVKDIYSSIKTGATLVIVPRELFSAPVKLLDYLCDNKITTMIWAVSAICLITTFHGLDYKTPETVNKILFSGEVMPLKHLREWQKHLPSVTFVNLYGPTEITCNCTYHVLDNSRDYEAGIPIGKHFPNEDVFLLDENNQKITATDTIGRIMVRGTSLALGYYRMPDKNEASFIQNPLNDCYPELVYNTGDLAKYDDNGDLIFCGRADNQVKYLGHRIELEEVERAMGLIDGVDRCFCIFDEKKSKLRGYYMGTIEKQDLQQIMSDTLPFFMVPGTIKKLDDIPLTKNGKIDRKKVIEMLGAK